ncbi:hypothetical protein, partial [Ideonella azotifigens]|uniref:hypothetical protein n=1 Tax=Ideonella azotifigens TaxID=513160 RepID=UPI001B882449
MSRPVALAAVHRSPEPGRKALKVKNRNSAGDAKTGLSLVRPGNMQAARWQQARGWRGTCNDLPAIPVFRLRRTGDDAGFFGGPPRQRGGPLFMGLPGLQSPRGSINS